jgi:predicted RNA-binding protein
MTYWIVVGSPENFDIATQRKFDLFGFKSTRRRESGEMRPGDKLVFYLTGAKKFGGIASVASESFEDHKKIFSSEKKPGEDYPFRVKTKPEVILSGDQQLDVPDYVPQLEFTRKGATKSWALFFQGNLHKISENDYKLIERDMRAASKKKPSKAKAAASAKSTAKRSPARKPAARPRSRSAPQRATARRTASSRRRR